MFLAEIAICLCFFIIIPYLASLVSIFREMIVGGGVYSIRDLTTRHHARLTSSSSSSPCSAANAENTNQREEVVEEVKLTSKIWPPTPLTPCLEAATLTTAHETTATTTVDRHWIVGHQAAWFQHHRNCQSSEARHGEGAEQLRRDPRSRLSRWKDDLAKSPGTPQMDRRRSLKRNRNSLDSAPSAFTRASAALEAMLDQESSMAPYRREQRREQRDGRPLPDGASFLSAVMLAAE